MNILAIIPARSGSKSIKDKNIRVIGGKPLLAYSIQHALESILVNRVIISTDSKKYGRIAQKYGAEFPFIRPAEISDDLSTDFEVFYQAINWLIENEGYKPDICVHLRPTYPIRNFSDIDKMIQLLIDNPEIDSVRSVAISPETPFKMWFRSDNGLIEPVIKSTIKDAFNQPRQNLPVTYLQNACIDVVRTATILHKKSMSGNNIYGYIMEHNWDIDYIHKLKKIRSKI